MTREEAIQEFQNVKDLVKQDGKDWFDERDLELIDMAIEALQASITEEHNKNSENDWDCPVDKCEDCNHHRGVSWCALAIPNHEEVDEEFKIRQEEFFKGLHAAEEHYKRIVEVLNEINEKFVNGEYVEPMRCKECRHRYEEGDNTHYYWCRLNDRPIDDTDYCSWAERREP